MRTLIRGGVVLSLGTKTPNVPAADVLVDGGKVVEVGPGLRVRDAEVVDATGAVVMPGFVDAHRHVWQTLLRHGEPASVVAQYGPHFQPDDVYAATLLGLLSAAEVGITTVVDWSDIHVDQGYTEAALQAHADAGLRTVLVPAPPTWASEQRDDGSALRRVVAAAGDGRVAPSIACGLPDGALADVDRSAARVSLARDLGLRLHAHAGLVESEQGAVAALAARGLLGSDTTLVHGGHLGAADLDAVSTRDAGVVLTPASDMTSGRPVPLQPLLDRGVRPGLAVDDDGMSPGDLFSQMRALQSLQHATYFDAKLAGKGGLPNLLSTRDVIRYATLDGARAIGLAAVTGSLEPGKQADIIVLRTDRANVSPVNDPIGAVVWGMDASNVDWVFVGGRPVVRDGILDADIGYVRDLAMKAWSRISAAAGEIAQPVPGART